jgi:hypothetical protein
MNTIILGDVHGCLDGLIFTLMKAGAIDREGNKNPDWRIVQVGDLANMAPLGQEYRGFLSEDLETVEFSIDVIDDQVVGNHEVIFTHGIPSGSWHGRGFQENGDFDPKLVPLMKRMANPINPMDKPKFVAAVEVDGMLVTHAGLHRDWLTHMGWPKDDPKQVASLLNDLLFETAMGNVALTNGFASDPINHENGIFWLRPKPYGRWDYGQGTEFMQVCGHTPMREHPKFYDHLNAWIIDSGGYMNKVNPHIPALIKYEGEDEFHVFEQGIEGEGY